MADVTVAELAERAEAKRHQVRQERGAQLEIGTASKVEAGVASETEPAVCSRCEERFDRHVTVIDGRRFRGPDMCGPCVKATELPAAPPASRSPETVLELLEAAGANAR